jgi:hypothetical protein
VWNATGLASAPDLRGVDGDWLLLLLVLRLLPRGGGLRDESLESVLRMRGAKGHRLAVDGATELLRPETGDDMTCKTMS